MKALIATAFGPPESLVLTDLPDPIAGPGQVVVDVRACGLNFPDALIIEGKYQLKPPFPFSPGCEVSGVVGSIGAGVTGLSIGHRVAAVPGYGGFAERVAVDAGLVTRLPPNVSDEVGAAILLAHGTSLYALQDRGRLARGETLLVLGAAGGVGLAAVEIGAALGARVIAAASSPAKLEVARRSGATDTIDYRAADLRDEIKRLTGGRGVDVVFDPVGGSLTEPAFRSLAWGGRHLVIGFASGEIPKLPLNLALLKSGALVGVFWGEFTKREPERYAANVRQLFQWLEAGTIAPRIDAVYPLARGGEAIRAMMDRKAVGKLVVAVGVGVGVGVGSNG